MIQAQLFRENEPPVSLAESEWSEACAAGENLLLLDVDFAESDELERIVERLEIDPRVTHDIRALNRQPLLRNYGKHFLLTVMTAQLEGADPSKPISVEEVDLIVGSNVLVCAHRGSIPFAEEVTDRIQDNPLIGAFSATALLQVVLDALLDHYSAQVEKTERFAEHLEDRLLRESGRQGLQDVGTMKRRIRAMRRVLAPHHTVFTSLIASDSPIHLHGDTEPFRDLVARLEGLMLRIDHVRDVATGAYDLYLSNMSFQTNQQLRVLTILSAVLLPMTLVTGMFGTNFKLAEYEAWEPFYVMLVAMLGLGTGMLLLFRFKRWL